jgi:thiamine monophosphate kinase
VFLGYQRVKGLDGQERDYYVRQLHDWKGVTEVDEMSVTGATVYARLCGATLARAHARWGDRVAIAAYLGKGETFERAIAEFSSVYADQNEQDHEALARAVRSGRVPAEVGL